MWPCNHSSTGRVVLRRSRAVLGWRRCQLYSGEAGAMQSFELDSDRRNVQLENAVRLQILQLGHCMKGAWTSDQACHNWPMCICRKAVHLVACAGAQKHLIRMCQGGAPLQKKACIVQNGHCAHVCKLLRACLRTRTPQQAGLHCQEKGIARTGISPNELRATIKYGPGYVARMA